MRSFLEGRLTLVQIALGIHEEEPLGDQLFQDGGPPLGVVVCLTLLTHSLNEAGHVLISDGFAAHLGQHPAACRIAHTVPEAAGS